MPLTATQQHYQDHLKAAEQTGMSLRAYAEENHIKVHSLYAERQRMRKQAKTDGQFLRVQEVASTPFAPMTLVQIRLPNGVSIGLPAEQVPLVDLIQTLAKL